MHIVLLCLVFLLFVPRAEAVPLAREALLAAKTEHWFGCYIQGLKVGYLHHRGVEVEDAEGTRLRLEERFQYFDVGGDPAQASFEQVTREFALAPPYALIARTQRSHRGGVEIENIIYRTPDGRMERAVREGGDERILPVSEVPTLQDALAAELLLVGGPPAAGHRTSYRQLDDDGRLATYELAYLGEEERSVDGETLRLHKVKASSKEIEVAIWMGADLEPRLIDLAGSIECRRESADQAPRGRAELDLFKLGMVPVDRPLGPPALVRSFRLELPGLGPRDLEPATGQRVTYDEERASWTVEVGDDVSFREPVLEGDRGDALAAAARYPIEDADVVALAHKAVGDADDPAERVARLGAFVADFIADKQGAERPTVKAILADPQGDCTEHALLFVTLARALGIPAREVSGLSYMGDEVQSFGGHAWAEVALDGYWQPVDPSYTEMPPHRARIRFPIRRFMAHLAVFQGLELHASALDTDAPAPVVGKALGTRFPIGAMGTLTLPEGWIQRRLNGNLGDYQFLSNRNTYLALLPIEDYFLGEEDYRQKLALFADSTSAGEAIRRDGEVGADVDGRTGTATLRFWAQEGGIELYYDISIISGLKGGVLSLLWGPASRRALVRAQGDFIREHFELALEPAEWVQAQGFDQGYGCRLAYRPELFAPITEEGFILSLNPAHGDLVLRIYLADAKEDPRALERDIFPAGTTLSEEDAGAVEHAGQRLSLTRLQPDQEPWTYLSAAVPVDDEIQAVVRFIYPAHLPQAQALFREMLGRFEMSAPRAADAFPLPAEKVSNARYRSPGERELLALGRLQGELPQRPYAIAARGEAVIAAVGDRLMALAGGEAKTLASLPEGRDLVLSPDGGYAILLGDENIGPVSRIDEGGLTELDLQASRVGALSGERLLLARPVRAAALAGPDSDADADPGSEPDADRAAAPAGLWPAAVETEVLLRTPDGGERLLARRPERIVRLVPDAEGEAVLLVRPAAWYEHDSGAVLERIDPERLDPHTGAVTALGHWRSFYGAGPAPGGWIVNGMPENQPFGTYRVGADGTHELLLPGIDWLPIAATETEILLGIGTDSDATAIHALPLAEVARIGPASGRFHRAALEEVGRAARARLGLRRAVDLPAQEAALRRFFAAADAVAVEDLGAGLPREVPAIDALLRNLTRDGGGSADALLVATAVVAHAWLEGGARWIDSEGPALDTAFDTYIERDPFAVKLNPAFVVASTLQDEVGWWNPAATVEAERHGRPLLLGTSEAALDQAADALRQGDLGGLLAAADSDRILARLAADHENLALREHVYQSLAARPGTGAHASVAAHFAAEPAAAPLDLLQHGLALTRSGADPEARILVLRRAIAADPDEALAYLLLGEAYEASERGDKAALALACYLAVTRMQTGGDVEARARTRIAAFDAASAAPSVPRVE